jgi:dipeptidase E
MRLYLSSLGVGKRPESLLRMLGDRRRVAYVPNAVDYLPGPDRSRALRDDLDELGDLGLEPTVVDLRDWFGHEGELRYVLAGADLVWVRGGYVFVLRRALRASGADRIVADLLERDAVVYGGYSAGPCMLGPTLRGIEGEEDDPTVVPEGYPAEVVWEGLGLLPYAIVPHYGGAESHGYRDWLIDNHVPFVALRDGEALVVDGDRTEVV